MDYQFILSGLEANLPGLHWILALLRTRIPSVDHFLGARHRIHEVCCNPFSRNRSLPFFPLPNHKEE